MSTTTNTSTTGGDPFPGTGGGSSGTTTTSTTTGTSGPSAQTRLLEVSAWDATTEVFLRPQGTEVWVEGHGSWYPNMQSGVDGPAPMGYHEVGVLHHDGFVMYPDGRDGAVCTVDFRVTSDMVDESHEAITQVEIYNTEVWIYGMAIPGHGSQGTAAVCPR